MFKGDLNVDLFSSMYHTASANSTIELTFNTLSHFTLSVATLFRFGMCVDVMDYLNQRNACFTT